MSGQRKHSAGWTEADADVWVPEVRKAAFAQHYGSTHLQDAVERLHRSAFNKGRWSVVDALDAFISKTSEEAEACVDVESKTKVELIAKMADLIRDFVADIVTGDKS